MENVTKVHGSIKGERRIRDMVVGEQGYTVPWAYDANTNHLNEYFTVDKEPGGTLSVLVVCVEPGKYELTFGG